MNDSLKWGLCSRIVLESERLRSGSGAPAIPGLSHNRGGNPCRLRVGDLCPSGPCPSGCMMWPQVASRCGKKFTRMCRSRRGYSI